MKTKLLRITLGTVALAIILELTLFVLHIKVLQNIPNFWNTYNYILAATTTASVLIIILFPNKKKRKKYPFSTKEKSENNHPKY